MKTKFLLFLFLAAVIMGCAKETTVHLPETTTQTTSRSNPVYVEQMSSLYMNCGDTATHINSNITGTVSTVNGYVLYDFTAVTDDGVKMHFKTKDMNGGTVANGDTLVMTYVAYTSACSSDSIVLRTNHNLPTFNVTTDADGNSMVTLLYSDCVLPLNGLSGHICIIWRQ